MYAFELARSKPARPDQVNASPVKDDVVGVARRAEKALFSNLNEGLRRTKLASASRYVGAAVGVPARSDTPDSAVNEKSLLISVGRKSLNE